MPKYSAARWIPSAHAGRAFEPQSDRIGNGLDHGVASSLGWLSWFARHGN
jgi:hypothetical protein